MYHYNPIMTLIQTTDAVQHQTLIFLPKSHNHIKRGLRRHTSPNKICLAFYNQTAFVLSSSRSSHFNRTHTVEHRLLESDEDSIEARSEPSHGLVTLDLVLESDTALGVLALGDAGTGAVHADVEVHSEDTENLGKWLSASGFAVGMPTSRASQ